MKHRLQTFLRHKLQWLVLLTALLGMGQEVWADPDPKIFYVSGDDSPYKLHLWKNGEADSECKPWKSPYASMTPLGSINNRYYFSYDYSSCSAIDRFKVYHDDWEDGSGDQTFPTDGRNLYDTNGKLGYYYPTAMSNIILKGILEDGKVTCYVGVISSWNSTTVYLCTSSNASQLGNRYIELPCTATFEHNSVTCRYSAAMAESDQYYISHSGSWTSAPRMDENAVAGKVYILGNNNSLCGGTGDHVCTIGGGASYSKAYFGSDNTATSLSITEGTASVTLTSTCSNGTTSAVGTALKYHYYLKNDDSEDYTLIGTEDVNTTSAIQLTYNTSSLIEGTYYIYPLLVDATNATVAVRPSSGDGDVLTLTVTSCNAPTATTGSATAAASSPFNSVTLTGTVAHDASCATTASGIILYEESTCETELARKTTASDVGTVTNLSFTFTTSDYSGLSAGATYWYKAFATNGGDTSYGNAGSVTLNCTAPTNALYTMAAGQSAEYNGSGHAPTISVTSGAGAVTKIWAKTSSDANWTDYGLTGPVNVGEYSIKVDVDGTATTYCATDGIVLDNTFSITQATPSTLTISTGNSSICSSPITLDVSGATEFTATPVYEIVNDASTTGTGSITNGVLTVTAAGDFKIRATKTDPAGNYTTAVATKVITVSDLPTTGITAVWNSGSESVWADKWADDRRTLTLTYPETGHYYQWVTCNSSGDEVVNSNVTFGSATAYTTTATLNLPGTYYFKCKVSCTDNGEKIASELVTFTTPMPEFGISGPFRYGGSWNNYNHCDAGVSIGETHGGLFTYAGIVDGYHTWSGTFKANNASGEFIIIQRYKHRCLCTECNNDTYMGWSGYQECNNTCSKSGTSTTTGSNANKINPSTVTLHDITGGTGNWTKSSSFPLSDGDIATIIVKMTGYDTYDVTLSQGCSTPSITVDPQTGDDISVCSSDAPTLSVTATSGTDPLTYQWYRTIESTATSGSSVTDAVSGTGANTYKPSASDMGEFRYYCIVRSAGACSAFSATSGVSKKIEIKQTPVVVPASKTVKQFEPVTLTATNSSVNWSITAYPGGAAADEYYLYDETKNSAMFKGETGSYTITATSTGDGSCTATSSITVEEDDDEGC